MAFWRLPEGLSVAPDGTWRVGDVPVEHATTLRWLKQHLQFEQGGAFVVDGAQRLPVRVEGPAFEVQHLRFDAAAGELHAQLDDGSEEPLRDGSLGLDEASGRFYCAVRRGRGRASLSRAALQQILDHVSEHEGGFALEVGGRRFTLRT
jgi:hypothetical protein